MEGSSWSSEGSRDFPPYQPQREEQMETESSSTSVEKKRKISEEKEEKGPIKKKKKLTSTEEKIAEAGLDIGKGKEKVTNVKRKREEEQTGPQKKRKITSQKESSMSDLPPELLNIIAAHSDAKTIRALKEVSHQFVDAICSQDSLIPCVEAMDIKDIDMATINKVQKEIRVRDPYRILPSDSEVLKIILLSLDNF